MPESKVQHRDGPAGLEAFPLLQPQPAPKNPLGTQNGSLEPRWDPKLELVLPQRTAFVYEVLSQSIQRTVTPHCKPVAPAHVRGPSPCPPRHWDACS